MHDKLVFEGPDKLSVQIFDKEFEMVKPSIRQQMDYENNVKSCKEDGRVIDIMVDYLCLLGADKEYVSKLNLSQMSQLLSALTGTSKKK